MYGHKVGGNAADLERVQVSDSTTAFVGRHEGAATTALAIESNIPAALLQGDVAVRRLSAVLSILEVKDAIESAGVRANGPCVAPARNAEDADGGLLSSFQDGRREA